jgi:hypothetical protein
MQVTEGLRVNYAAHLLSNKHDLDGKLLGHGDPQGLGLEQSLEHKHNMNISYTPIIERLNSSNF